MLTTELMVDSAAFVKSVSNDDGRTAVFTKLFGSETSCFGMNSSLMIPDFERAVVANMVDADPTIDAPMSITAIFVFFFISYNVKCFVELNVQ